MKYLFAMLVALISMFPASAQIYNFSIYAGQSGVIGTNDGVGTNALFNHPRGVAVDPAGNVFVADTHNASIRRIGTDGSSTTIDSFALTGGPGSNQPGAITAGYFVAPENVTEDSQSNLYVLDKNLIYYLTVKPELVQNGTNYIPNGNYDASGYQIAGYNYNYSPVLTLFNHPHGIGVDSSGNIFLADQFNDVIREITPAGDDLVFAGQPGTLLSSNGIGTNAQIFLPYGLAVDSASNLFVTDDHRNILKITSSADVTTWMSLTNYSPSATAIACDQAGNVYVPAGNTNGANTVLRIDSNTNITVIGQLPTSGTIAGMAIDASNNIYLADRDNSVIIKGTPVAFFNGATLVSNGEYELIFPDATPFGFYYPQDFPDFYHVDMGWEHFVDASDGQGGAYLYDFSSGDWWYTSPQLFPYLYDFTLNAWLYYFPDTTQADHYTTNPRSFYDFSTESVITR